MRRIVSGVVSGDRFPLEFPENLAQVVAGGQLSEMALRSDLELIIERVGRPTVLLIDEAQLISSDQDVLSVLRNLGTQLRGYVFVLAGTNELLEQVPGPASTRRRAESRRSPSYRVARRPW